MKIGIGSPEQNWYTHSSKNGTNRKVEVSRATASIHKIINNFFIKKNLDFFDCQGKSKNHVVSTKFKYPLCAIQEKGRRILIHF